MSENKIVKTLTEASMLAGLSAGIGWLGKKMMKESLTKDPSESITNFAKWTVVLAGSIALKDYLEAQKIRDWIAKQHSDERIASQNLGNVDNALRLYNQFHRTNIILTKPNFSHYYKKSQTQKNNELIYVSGGMLVVSYFIAKFI